AAGGPTSTSIALVAVAGKGLLPPLRYRWSDALADGAGGAAAAAAWGRLRPVLTAGAAKGVAVVSSQPVRKSKAKHHHRRHRPAQRKALST
ncbi:MAG TPA: hypothetical protein VKJ07_25745, partial [Mycobacteriales bacterium]|nr:hypothetical protein [Mycobacteriales bacterium]